MTKFTYVGDPNAEDEREHPKQITYLGSTFDFGKPVEVSEDVAKRLEGNRHFQKSNGAAKPTAKRAKAKKSS